MTQEIQELLNKIEKTYHPVSIFLYGSRARTDFLGRSDYEMGVLYRRDKKISRLELKAINPIEGVNLYPFEYEDFLDYKMDTPFPEAIYFRELIAGGKTIVGERVVEKMKAPPIRTIDLLQRGTLQVDFRKDFC